VLASIPSPATNGLHLGPLFLHAYGIAYAVGIAAAIVIARRRWRAQGGDPDVVYEVAFYGVPAGILGGRLYFDITSSGEVPHTWWGWLAVWQGGLGIWGGIAGGTLAGLWLLRRRGVELGRFMDAAAPGILVAQAAGRVGNYFNQELFGGPTNLPWALRIDPAHRPDGYERYATFHPTFLYELIFDLTLAAALVWLGRRREIRAPGLFALYVAGYSGFRIFEELLRIDPAEHILGLRLNFFIAAIACVAGLAWFARTQRGKLAPPPIPGRGPAALGIALIAGALIGCGHGEHERPANTGPTALRPPTFALAEQPLAPGLGRNGPSTPR
jgi:prolipoprotein diacylglyceryl transferase